MLLNQDYVTPAELTGYVRTGLADQEINQPTLARWLPPRLVPDIQYRFGRGSTGLTEATKFRTFDAPARIGGREGITRVTGELPPLSEKMRLSEEDYLRLRNADVDAIRGQLESDAMILARRVEARLELARGEALYSGAVTIAENGVTATVTFGRSGSHTVAPGTLWSVVATATPLADELSWIDTYIASNGVPPGAAICSTTVLGYLLRNAEYRAIAGSTLGTPTRISRSTLNSIREDHGLPPIYVIDEQFKVDGVATRALPADRFVLLPAPNPDPETNELGATFYGTTAEADEFQIEESLAAGIVAAAYKTDDPVATWTKAAGIGLPVLANPDLSFAADVA